MFGETYFLFLRQLAVFLLYPHIAEEIRKFSGASLEGINLIHEGSALMANYLPKTIPPDSITLAIRFPHINFREHKHSVCITSHNFG